MIEDELPQVMQRPGVVMAWLTVPNRIHTLGMC